MSSFRKVTMWAIAAFCLGGCAAASRPQGRPAPWVAQAVSVVPRPREMQAGVGVFAWPQHIVIAASNAKERQAAQTLAEFASEQGLRASIGGSGANIRVHILRQRDPHLGAEGYVLRIDSRGVAVQANAPAGLFYGLQTLQQLSERRQGALFTRVVVVRDWPALRWRGIHLDVSRHFFAASVVKRYIELAAHYKLNVFHWHLTDDQAWRLQIAAYPKLTGSGGSYTASQVRDIVAYAAARFVTVVPEIDIPGHAGAALRAYPDLNCAGFYCANTRSEEFLETALGEVFALFPSTYVHIGGDEVTYTPGRTRLMRAIEQYARAHGRRIVVWDDALHAGLSHAAIIMAWHGERAVIAAMSSGQDTVAAPDGPLYFDAYQGNAREEPRAAAHLSTLEQVYAFDPRPDGAPTHSRSYLLGVQGNVWTERIMTPEHLFYMVLPRELALAEVAWLPPQRKNWDTFIQALPAQFAWLDHNHFTYRVPNAIFEVSAAPEAFIAVPGNVQAAIALTSASHATIRIHAPLRAAQIHYTTDGSMPSTHSRKFSNALHLALPARTRITVRAIVVTSNGRSGAISECIVQRVRPQDVRQGRGYSRSWAGLVSP